MEGSPAEAALDRESVRDILLWGCEDWVDLAFARQYVSDEIGQVPPAELRRQTIEIVGQLLEADLFVAGDLSASGFAPWPLDARGSVERIRQEWDDATVTMHTGDVCWLQITDEGRALAQSLVEAE